MANKTVMVVDDLPFVRKTLVSILTGAQYTVVAEASDGLEAIELYIKHRPDIVTMDIVMPKMSGIEAARKIMKIDKEAKIIIISAMEQETMVMDAIAVGARDYIMKPFSAEEILKTFAHIFDKGDEESHRR
jgi:two-component system chemotaxis response regulator CheY